MSTTPDLKEQILQSHAGLIHRVVMHCNNPGSVPDLEQVLKQAEDNDWNQLVAAIREIMAGKRDESILLGLDNEDRTVLEDLQADFDANMAAPGLAGLIHASRKGNLQALQIVGNLAKQMLAAGGDMGILSGRLRPLIEGERDADKLTEKMSPKGQKLMLDIIEELLKLEAN
jgi:hypothetical protein